jgi:type II secretory pathway component GspD/PulD (secretin)
MNCDQNGMPRMSTAQYLFGLVLILTIFVPGAFAQTQPADSRPAEQKPAAEIDQTVYLTNLTQQNDANDIVTDLRNMVPRARLYYVSSPNAISIHGTPDDVQRAQKILADIDRAKKVYRLSYTINEIDNGKRIGAQRFALVVVAGGKTLFKQGSRMPIVTGTTTEAGSSSQSSQVQYLDVGLTIEASLDGERLHTKVEQSSLSDEKSGISVQDPIVRQTVLETVSILAPKPFVLGSLDVPGTTRHLQIEVASELVQ